MIDAHAPASSWFLWMTASFFLVCFALPLVLAPLRWARLFQWRSPPDDPLTVYFGRCLGAVALAIVACCFRAAPTASTQPLLFDLIIAAGVLLALVHVWGALERKQPWTETAEIALYVGAAAAAWALHP
jgi:hypothetical protein